MHLIRVGTAVLNQTPLAWNHNQRNIEDAIDQAKAERVSLLCLPELCVSGYGCEDAFQSPSVQQMAWEVVRAVAARTDGIAVSLGLPLYFRSAIYDCACLVTNGEVLGFAAKRNLAGEGIHYEPRWFRPWPEGAIAEVELGGRRYPIGDLIFGLNGVRVGFEICEDAWVAERPGVGLARRGVDVVLNPSASHFAFGKHEIRKRFVIEGSRFLGVAYAYANLLGNEAGRAIYDGDALIAACGDLRAAGPRFSFADCQLTTAVVDLDRCRMLRSRTGGVQPDPHDPDHGLVTAKFTFPELEPEPVDPQAIEPRFLQTKEEEFTRAMALGMFDYMRKSRSCGFVLSLSGGADSAAIACLTSLMIDLALAELGPEGLRAKLPYVPGVKQAKRAEDWMRALLTTVYQSTANSGEVTRTAARTLAESLGAQHLEFDIEQLRNAYVKMVSDSLGRALDWQSDDVALQNIQARTRAPGVWLLANVKNALLLATSNRSEAAVGYATMDGDTCGGLSPLAGIDKTYLRHWLRWLEQHGPNGLRPIPALARVNAQAPTAELRPKHAKQTDEDDLMPYALLDAIERAAIRDKQGPVEVFRRMRVHFKEHGSAQLARWVERFFRLWARNQWKRERYAPSFHLDDENLDPRSWCRFPILSGGFEREIDDLRAYVKRRGERAAKSGGGAKTPRPASAARLPRGRAGSGETP